MKLITPSVEYIPQLDNTINGIFKQIEKAGRTCYKSEDKITEDSAESFVHSMIKSNHNAMLEHGTVYMKMTIDRTCDSDILRFPWYRNNEPTKRREVFGYVQSLFMFNPYSVVNLNHDMNTDSTVMCITTNYRVIIENHWEDIMNDIICEPTPEHTPRITLKFTTNIGVTREGNRMRANSIAEESTRYCNYTKEKFGSELNICPPVWIANKTRMLQTLDESEWMNWINGAIGEGRNPDLFNCDAITWYGMSIAFAQVAYRNLIRLGWKPQQAREVLPLATKSDVVYTAFPHQWKHFFDLRLFGTTGKPHPNMEQISEKARDILIKNNLWNLIYNPDDKTC